MDQLIVDSTNPSFLLCDSEKARGLPI